MHLTFLLQFVSAISIAWEVIDGRKINDKDKKCENKY